MKDLTFIAEIGMNHNGNFGLVFELVKQAAASGADFAKFQLGWRCGPGEINVIQETELQLIIDCCEYHGIKPLLSLITPDALEMALDFEFEAYKIASRTIRDDFDLAQRIVGQGKPTFVSLGFANSNCPLGKSDQIKYLWCKSEYPALPWSLKDMPKTFSESSIVGYSDHSIGIDVPLMAITRGACVIEKHFTLDKSDTTIRDHALSATPDEFRLLVDIGRAIKKNLNLGV